MKKLILFLVLAYFISWSIWAPLYLECNPNTSLIWYLHPIGALGPMLAAFAVSAIYDPQKLRLTLKRVFMPGSISILLLALVSPFCIGIFSSAISAVVNGEILDLSGLGYSTEFPDWSILTFFIYNLIFFGFGEETGWRGFALPILQSKFGAFLSSIILTIGWALWHIPLFFYRPGYTQMSAPDITGWLLSLLAGSVLLTWFYNKSMKSIFVCAVFHTTIDIAFTSRYADPLVPGIMGAVITIWGICIAIVLYKKDGVWRKRKALD